MHPWNPCNHHYHNHLLHHHHNLYHSCLGGRGRIYVHSEIANFGSPCVIHSWVSGICIFLDSKNVLSSWHPSMIPVAIFRINRSPPCLGKLFPISSGFILSNGIVMQNTKVCHSKSAHGRNKGAWKYLLPLQTALQPSSAQPCVTFLASQLFPSSFFVLLYVRYEHLKFFHGQMKDLLRDGGPCDVIIIIVVVVITIIIIIIITINLSNSSLIHK